ncbi:Adhesion G protein-coupled receptor F5 [Bagarius yarrelli]|uniref:Adhesion G protein-coupled receptor F5 n=1 Tax=Bagarius yarrelli TaxID=175774 RepID=A0A556U2R5_BAGYA|nr:Adhesion G protein-coupled receptor F5 [Bagarius yarrelli]
MVGMAGRGAVVDIVCVNVALVVVFAVIGVVLSLDVSVVFVVALSVVLVAEMVIAAILRDFVEISVDVSDGIAEDVVDTAWVCILNGTDYQCRCENQYFWPYEKCIENKYCDDIMEGKCGCINALPNDGQFCQLLDPVPWTDYLVEVEIAMIDPAEVTLLRNKLETLTLPLISSYTIITEIDITTVCILNGTHYQCRCENPYSWPYETCIENRYCDDITAGTCGCISSLPDNGQFCQPFSELTLPQTDYLVEIEIAMIDALLPLRNELETLSLPLISSYTIITELNITTVCLLSGTGYQCKCEDQYSWPYKKCIENGYCDDFTNGTCGCINALPNDSQLCQPISDLTLPQTDYLVEMEIEISDPETVILLKNYLNTLNLPLIISDIMITDLNITTVKDGLYRNSTQIYPENDLILTCKTANDSITWTKDGKEIVASDKYIINKTSLIVKNTTPTDTGVYDCRTTQNLMPYIIWQSIMILDPNIQVNISKSLTCQNTIIRLQCCVLPRYNVTWLTEYNEECRDPVQENSCIYCDYSINQTKCQADNHPVTLTCKLTKKFACSDNRTETAFGAGQVNEYKTGGCNRDMIGYKIAQCVAPGYWIVTYDNCVTRVIKYLYDISPKLIVTDLMTFAQNVSTAAIENASEITKSPATILTIVELLKTIADLAETVFINQEIMQNFLLTLDVIGSTDAQDAWLYLNNNSTTMVKSSELLNSTERISRRLKNLDLKPPQISTKYSTFHKYNEISEPFIDRFGKNLTTLINIPTINTPTSITVIVSSVFNNILPVRNLTSNNNRQTGTTINGDVALIQANSIINNVSISFEIINKTLENPQCVFWNFGLLNGIGGWDSSGCRLKRFDNKSDVYTCECDHITSFSILMSPFTPDNCALDVITYIGVGISMGSLVLCLIIEFIVWKSVGKSYTSHLRHIAIVNVAVSLLIANICFIIGAAVVKKDEGPCSTATFFMHFFYLAVFFWMLLSALLLLYCVFTMVHKISKGTMKTIGFTVGYGAPLLIAVITVASTAGNRGYIQQGYNCWLNWNETKALLAFVIPALTIVAINLLVLIVVLCKMLRRGGNSSTQTEDKHPLLVIARCVGFLTPLFGLTWGFGIGTMVSKSCGVHVVFAFLNSLQVMKLF